MLLPFRLRRFISGKFVNYTFDPLKEYDHMKHVPVRNRKGSHLIEKKYLLHENNQPVTFVIISDASYFVLALEQIQSIQMIEPDHEIYIFDIGLKQEQKEKLNSFNTGVIKMIPYDISALRKEHDLLYEEAIYFLKIIAVEQVSRITKNKLILYSDVSNLFLKPLNELKNFISEYGFYGGMTSTYLFEHFQKHEQFRKLAEEWNINIFDKRFFLIEGGFWGIDLSHDWAGNFLMDYFRSAKEHINVYRAFPHDMVVMSILLTKYLLKDNIMLNELPNIRFKAILEKRRDIEKNMVVYDYHTEKIPFFGYACHNCSNDPDAPEKRRCSVFKADFKEYMKK
jgi:hypothetical protein